MIVADTSGLLALLDRGEPAHDQVRDVVDRARGPLVTTDLVLAETDFLILKRLGREAEARFLRQVVSGALVREPVSHADLERAHDILIQFSDQAFGLTDASLMAVAERLGPAPVLTLDHRHFWPFRTRKGKALEILPG